MVDDRSPAPSPPPGLAPTDIVAEPHYQRTDRMPIPFSVGVVVGLLAVFGLAMICAIVLSVLRGGFTYWFPLHATLSLGCLAGLLLRNRWAWQVGRTLGLGLLIFAALQLAFHLTALSN